LFGCEKPDGQGAVHPERQQTVVERYRQDRRPAVLRDDRELALLGITHQVAGPVAQIADGEDVEGFCHQVDAPTNCAFKV
jgi:hypothetical protein